MGVVICTAFVGVWSVGGLIFISIIIIRDTIAIIVSIVLIRDTITIIVSIVLIRNTITISITIATTTFIFIPDSFCPRLTIISINAIRQRNYLVGFYRYIIYGFFKQIIIIMFTGRTFVVYLVGIVWSYRSIIKKTFVFTIIIKNLFMSNLNVEIVLYWAKTCIIATF